MGATNRCTESRWGFSGEASEVDCDLYVLGGRIYCPALRRFLSADPVSPMRAGGMHRYAYCGGDPIQRIDPGGNTWLDWLSSGLGLLGAIAGTVMSAIALVGSGGLATPAIVALGAALALDAVSVVAEVGSMAGLMAGDSAVAQTFGWIALGTGMASVGAGAVSKAATKAAARVALSMDGGADVAASSQSIKRTILPLQDLEVGRRPSVLPGENAWEAVGKAWHRTESERIPGAIHYGADTQVGGEDVWRSVHEIDGRTPRSTSIYVYSGVHGAEDGQNWSGQSRLGGDLDEAVYSHRMRRKYTALKKRRVDVVNLSFLTPAEALGYWKRPGVHIHGYCFGAVDELLLTVFGKTEAVPVYL